MCECRQASWDQIERINEISSEGQLMAVGMMVSAKQEKYSDSFCVCGREHEFAGLMVK